MKSLARSLCTLLVVWMAFASFASPASATASPSHTNAAVPGDRWLEIDLYWFDRDHMQDSVNAFWDRFTPLYQGVEGDKGLILNVGWTVGYIMEWSGDLQQRITLPLGTGEQPWVAETAALPGSTAQRREEWKQRFAKPIMVQKHGYGPWTYGDLKQLANLLRSTAAQRGIRQFKVGSLVYAWDNAYGEVAPWAKRHPEAFTVSTDSEGRVYAGARRFFNPANTLHADPVHLGGLPHGLTEGMSVHAAFAAQWGSLSRATGLDALILRDSFGFPVPYTRRGPHGAVMPSHEAIQQATASVSALVRETKLANPHALLMMYSNAASAISDWRSNGCDLEQIAKEGYLDIFVDQTWAGAWNEVGVRHNNFWNSPTLGWTYQLAYMLMHGAMLANTKVRHYPLVETFDAWESWDVLHTVPQRLRWGIWAYSHASVKTPHGLVMPQGSYISWANQGKRLLSPEDVAFLSTNIDAAVRDASQTKEIYGPTLVYSRSAMRWQIDHAAKDTSIKEWIDEQAGSLMKWQVPILSATRVEWLGSLGAGTAIVQTPSHLHPSELSALQHLIHSGHPVALFGSFAGGIDPQLLSLAGLHEFHPSEPKASVHSTAQTGTLTGLAVEHVPSSFPVRELLDAPITPSTHTSAAAALYSVSGVPQLLLSREAKQKLLLWDPPEFTTRHDQSLLQLWGGSAASYVLTAAAINTLQRDAGLLHVQTIDADQTGSMDAWKTADGTLHLLFGNLEEGLREDADRSRHFNVALPASWRKSTWHSIWSGSSAPAPSADLPIQLAPEQSILLESATK